MTIRKKKKLKIPVGTKQPQSMASLNMKSKEKVLFSPAQRKNAFWTRFKAGLSFEVAKY